MPDGKLSEPHRNAHSLWVTCDPPGADISDLSLLYLYIIGIGMFLFFTGPRYGDTLMGKPKVGESRAAGIPVESKSPVGAEDLKPGNFLLINGRLKDGWLGGLRGGPGGGGGFFVLSPGADMVERWGLGVSGLDGTCFFWWF